MKRTLLLLSFVFIILIEFSCSKENAEMNSLVGKWSVVNDSISNSAYIYTGYVGDSIAYTGNYMGESGDYFNFTSNGTLSILLDSNLFSPIFDSGKYNVMSNSQVEISIYYISGGLSGHYINPVKSRTYVISKLTSHSATLTFQNVYSSTGNISRIQTETINLKK